MNGFMDLMRMHRRGTLLDDLDNELQVAIATTRETGKPAELTLKLKITPQRGQTDSFLVTDTFATKLPKSDVADTVLYVNENGELTQRDPRQPELPTIGDTAKERSA